MRRPTAFLIALTVAAGSWCAAPLIAQTSIYILGRGGVFTSPVLYPDGSAAAPSIAFASDPTKGLYSAGSNLVGLAIAGAGRHLFGGSSYAIVSDSAQLIFGVSQDTTLARGGAAGKLTLTGTTPMIQLGGTTSSSPALKQSGTSLQARLADDSGFAPLTGSTITATVSIATSGSGTLLYSATAPTISSGFGTSPSVSGNNGTAAFEINVGTGGTATSGVIGLPTATTGWNCYVNDITTNVATRQTASSTTSATVTAASAWTASDKLRVSCFAY